MSDDPSVDTDDGSPAASVDPETLESPVPDCWREGEVDVDGVRIHYLRTGDGSKPPLVLAHGVFDDAACRTPLIRDLESEYDVVAFDARGHGLSDAPGSGYGPDDRASDLVGLVEALDLADPVLVGHSMGGDTVLAAAAASEPALPRAVVAIDPACLLGQSDAEEDGTDRVDDVRDRILWWHDHSKAELLVKDDEIAGHVADGDDELASLVADARLRVSPAITAVFEKGWFDPAERFPDVAAPTLVLRADVDKETRRRDREAVDLLPDGRFVTVDGAGHTVFRDRREAATDELRAFLTGI